MGRHSKETDKRQETGKTQENGKRQKKGSGRMRQAALLAAAALALTACGEQTSQGTDTLATDTLAANGTVGETLPDVSQLFTDRDLSGSYDPAECTAISLTGDGASSSGSSVAVTGNTVTITDEGTYLLSGSLEGMVVVEAADTDKVQLVLDGVEISNHSGAAIYAKSADKLFVTLAADAGNSLTGGGYVAIDENNIDGVIFSKCDLTINGSGSLSVTAEDGHGVVTKDDLAVTGGSLTITAQKGHGLEGKDSVRVGGGQIGITAGKDGINSEGDVTVSGGTLQMCVEDDGVHADGSASVLGGCLEVTQGYEGIEGNQVQIAGGEIRLNVSDDGLNAAGGNDQSGFGAFPGNGEAFGGSDASIVISGGMLKIHAAGDGIDSNGDLTVTGGETYVSGPEDGANASLDYGGTGQITGGVLAAAGDGRMAMNFGDASTQGSILLQVSDCQAGEEISLADETGEVLVQFLPESAFNCVVVSCPQLEQGRTYTLTAGDTTQEITLEQLIYGDGMDGRMGPGGRNPGGMGGEMPPGEMSPGEMPPGGMDPGQMGPRNLQN